MQVGGQQVPQNVNVNDLSGSQVKQAKQALDNSGLSREAAIEVARQKGANEQQIQDMLKRMEALEGTQPTTTDPLIDQYLQVEDSTMENITKEKTEIEKKNEAPSASKTRFGAYLFNNSNLTFEPNTNISTPKNYIINLGDQIIITIWGNSQASYQLVVNRNGQIHIPDIGPVYVAGLSFENAEKRLIEKLSSIYSDMQGSTPKTFAQVDLGKMRSIKVNIIGESTTPGTYTLPATASVFNALYLSGGPNNIGSFRAIRLIRNNKTLKTIDIYKYLTDGDLSENLILQDEDIIFIPTVEKQVEVRGEFKRNALFELKENESLNALIVFAGGYTDETYLYRMKLYRKTQEGYRIIDFLQSEITTTPLESGDELVAEKILELFKNRVSISGSVYRPGDYQLTEGLTLSGLIQKADSITPDAFYKGGHILRLNDDWTMKLIPFTLAQVLSGEKDYPLQIEDQIVIKSHLQMKEKETVTISGEVINPFTFTYIDDMTLRDAVYLANGFKEGADSSYIEVSRRLGYEKESQLSDTLRYTFYFTLPRNLDRNNPDGNFKLKPYDRISVRRAPGFREPEEASVLGEVKFAGSYALNLKSMRISDLIVKAGGLTQEAYPEGAYFQRINKVLGTEVVGINLPGILSNANSKDDLFLMNGDVLVIPKRLQTVKVSGNILNPLSLTYEPEKSIRYYIDKTGGFNENTRKNKIYVKYPNGTTATTRSFIGFRNYPAVKPGAEIIVPLRPEKEKFDQTGKWLAIASTLSSLTVAITAIIANTK